MAWNSEITFKKGTKSKVAVYGMQNVNIGDEVANTNNSQANRNDDKSSTWTSKITFEEEPTTDLQIAEGDTFRMSNKALSTTLEATGNQQNTMTQSSAVSEAQQVRIQKKQTAFDYFLYFACVGSFVMCLVCAYVKYSESVSSYVEFASENRVLFFNMLMFVLTGVWIIARNGPEDASLSETMKYVLTFVMSWFGYGQAVNKMDITKKKDK